MTHNFSFSYADHHKPPLDPTPDSTESSQNYKIKP